MPSIHDRNLTDGLILLATSESLEMGLLKSGNRCWHRAHELLFLMLLVVIGFVWLTILVLFAAIYHDRCCPRCRRVLISYFGAGENSDGARGNITWLVDLSTDERRKILKVLFPPKPYQVPKLVETENAGIDVENLCSEVTNPRGATQPGSHRLVLETNEAQDGTNSVNLAQHGHTCAICLQNYVVGEDVVVGRGCPHIFHNDCVMTWLDEHDRCPCCRKEMMTTEDMRAATLQLSNHNQI